VEDGPVATRIWLAEGQPAQLAAAMRAPEPEQVQDPSFGVELEFYEGEAEFTLPLRVAGSDRPGRPRWW
jgi:hypothetical protein